MSGSEPTEIRLMLRAKGRIAIIHSLTNGDISIPTLKSNSSEFVDIQANNFIAKITKGEVSKCEILDAFPDDCFLFSAEIDKVIALNVPNSQYYWVKEDVVLSDAFGVFGSEEIHRIKNGGINDICASRLISESALSSPFFFYEAYYFDIRITSTGISSRDGGKTFCFRDPSEFLTNKFMDLCVGVPVIFGHPSAEFSPSEFKDRIIGSIIFPYIKGADVWGIARIYSEKLARKMYGEDLSTSPSCINPSQFDEYLNINGETIVKDRFPIMVSHIAICDSGVWDKYGEPRGINITNRK